MKTEKGNINSPIGCIGVVLFMVALGIAGVALNGWAIQILWGWFIVPTFQAVPLSFHQALGLGLVVGYLTYQYPGGSDSNDSDSKSLGQILFRTTAELTFRPLVSVAFGWIYVKAFGL